LFASSSSSSSLAAFTQTRNASILPLPFARDGDFERPPFRRDDDDVNEKRRVLVLKAVVMI
jgi:hypothetical protein